MPLTPQEKTLFHHIETSVLDQQHLTFDLLRFETDTAIPSLVQCYDQAMCEAIRGKKSNEYVSNIGSAGMRGIPRAIQWFQLRDTRPLSGILLGGIPTREKASELLKWAISYDKLYNQHVALRKQMVDVTIDGQQRTISFHQNLKVVPKYFVSQQEAMADEDGRRRQAFPNISVLADDWSASVSNTGTVWSANDSLLHSSGAVDLVQHWVKQFCLPELGDSESLGTFSVGDLRRVVAALYAYSHCHTSIQNGTDLPVTAVVKSRAGFIHWLCLLTGLSTDVLTPIADIFHYGSEPQRITLGQKPLIRFSSGTVFSPYMFDGLAPEQLVIGALNASPQTRNAYAAAINLIETEGVKAIVERLRQLLPGTKVLRQPPLRFGDGNLYTPDIVAYQPQTNHILVSDIKFACMPFSVGDVYSDIDEFQGWKAKMREYVEHVQREPERVLALMNVPMTSTPAATGLICPRWPLPVPVEFDASLAAVDYGSLTSHLAKTGELPLAELHRWATDRPDVPVASSVREIAKEVMVGDWAYRYHVLSP